MPRIINPDPLRGSGFGASGQHTGLLSFLLQVSQIHLHDDTGIPNSSGVFCVTL